MHVVSTEWAQAACVESVRMRPSRGAGRAACVGVVGACGPHEAPPVAWARAACVGVVGACGPHEAPPVELELGDERELVEQLDEQVLRAGAHRTRDGHGCGRCVCCAGVCAARVCACGACVCGACACGACVCAACVCAAREFREVSRAVSRLGCDASGA
eukprot:1227637-Prymnesium_polylepis.1